MTQPNDRSRPAGDNGLLGLSRTSMKRRTLLGLGVVGGLVVAGGGALVAAWQPGWAAGRLTPRGRLVFGAVADAVLAELLPAEPAARRAAIDAHLDRLDVTVRAMHPATRKEIEQLTALIAHPAGRRLLVGLGADWADARTPEVQGALATLRVADNATRQQIYHALRDLTNAAYFSDRSTWGAIGYPGPVPL